MKKIIKAISAVASLAVALAGVALSGCKPKHSHTWGDYITSAVAHWKICRSCDEQTGWAMHDIEGGKCTVCEYEIYYTLWLSYEILEDSCLITGLGTVTKKDVNVPPDHADMPVTAIGDGAFYACSGLENVVLPDSVTSIGEYAFTDCISLEGIIIPHSVTSIGAGAFAGCEKLKNVKFGGTVEQWESLYTFQTADIFTVYCSDGTLANS